jgi:glutamyl-tRNA synthetase
MIKVRFAPSPTGYLHIGGARTALFNWLYARSQGGIFVLRIEDTDLERSQKKFVDEILDSMSWLGLNWDELYYQSQRFDIYLEHAKRLEAEGKAYTKDGAIILKTPRKNIKVYDLIRGEIDFDTANFTALDENGKPLSDSEGNPLLKDEVLIKSDGSPTYNFCCVVDDSLMGITHVIRGDDHISNTPKQLVIYEALGFKPPKYAHLPLIMGEDGGRLSKRTGAVAVSDYRRLGFLPEAIVNYLMLLGWSPGNNQEIISLKNAVAKFSIKKVNKAAAVFSLEKLTWLNQEYIKSTPASELTDILINYLPSEDRTFMDFDRKKKEAIVELYQKRIPTLADFASRADFIINKDWELPEEQKRELIKNDLRREFDVLADYLNTLDDFSHQKIEERFRSCVKELEISMSDIVHPVRIVLSGSDVGPGLFETMAVLGKELTVKRLRHAFKPEA